MCPRKPPLWSQSSSPQLVMFLQSQVLVNPALITEPGPDSVPLDTQPRCYTMGAACTSGYFRFRYAAIAAHLEAMRTAMIRHSSLT
ncbi:hypothetical protein GOODEAATRI_026914 [Goodea atripinnis]|uniref:Uncharacterized protein n=1 Tax=Goodea atripinnis TaxID=208336 RepID=A0ABV0N4M2_9TELE